MTQPLNTQQLINQVVRSAVWRLTWRLPTWALILIVGAAFLYSLAHATEWREFDSNGMTIIQGPNGYRANAWTMPNGNTFGSDSRGNTLQEWQSGPTDWIYPPGQ